MGLFYKASYKELLEIRNKIFVQNGIPALERNGFQKSPFKVDWFGRNNLGDYTYCLCRLNANSHLQKITTHISKGDRWIQIYLNIFHLQPNLKTLEPLQHVDGMQFHFPPNNLTKMKLRSDDFKGMPIFNTVHHKVKRYYTKRSLEKRIDDLGRLINKDLNNIDAFVSRWHELHQPLITNWEGVKMDL